MQQRGELCWSASVHCALHAMLHSVSCVARLQVAVAGVSLQVLASCKALGTPEAGEARDVKPEPESEDLYLSQHLPQIGNFLLDEAHARRGPQRVVISDSSPSTASTLASQFAQTASSCSQGFGSALD